MSEKYGSEEFKEGTFSVSLCCFHSFSVPVQSLVHQQDLYLHQNVFPCFSQKRMMMMKKRKRSMW